MRGYPVREVSNRLGVSASSLYKWPKLCGGSASKQDAVDHDAETRRLKRDLARMTEERDILKKAPVGSTGQRHIFDLRCSDGTYDGTNRSPWRVTGAEG